MATVVVMPALGNSVETCLIVAWAVKEGDDVAENAVLCEVETDKATMEVPSTASGTVLKLLWSEGDEVPVMEPLLVLGEPGEDPGPVLAEAGAAVQPTESDTPEAPAGEASYEDTDEQAPAGNEPVETVEISGETAGQPAPAGGKPATGISPRARNLAAAKDFDATAVAEGTGPGGRVIERDVAQAISAAPATRAGARAGGGSAGTGIGGRFSAGDASGVQGAPAQETPAAQPAAAVPAAETDFPGPSEQTPLKGIRKTIADRMMNSLASSAQLTYTATANAQGLLDLRKRLKNSPDELGMNRITIGDLVGYAAIRTAALHPSHNAHLSDGVLTTFERVHLGFACDTPRGLLVPTVRNASQLSLREFSNVSKELAAQAIEGKISPDLLQGATFTVSNLGGFGIESFTPLLNVPQTAILGVDAIFPRATVGGDGQVGVEQRIGLSLTADHRVIDGADAARFLQTLVRFIENIEFTVMG